MKLKTNTIKDINVRNELRANKKIYKDNLKIILNNLIDDVWRDESLLLKRDQKVEKFKKHMKSEKTSKKENRVIRDRSTVKKVAIKKDTVLCNKETRNMKRTQSQFAYSKNKENEVDDCYFSKKHLQVANKVKELMNMDVSSNKERKMHSTKLKCQKRLDFNIIETPGPAFYNTAKDVNNKGITFAKSKRVFMDGKYNKSDAPGPMYKIN